MASTINNSSEPINRQRSEASRITDQGFQWLTGAFAVGVAVVLVAIAWEVGLEAIPAIQRYGLRFITSTAWNPIDDQYGAWPFVYGTLVSSIIALVLALPIGLGVAIFLSEDFLPPKAQQPIVFLVELLAAIPSVVYGLWGIFVLIPLLGQIGTWLHENLGWIPIFSTAPRGPGMHVAGVVLAIMILPIIAAISRDALVSVPTELRQGAYGLGATRWEALFKILIPAAFSGIVGGTMLALGRALGETMAVTMVIGNAINAPISILAPASTVSALLANQFQEARGLQVSALMYAALLLFALTLVVNVLAELLVRSVRIRL